MIVTLQTLVFFRESLIAAFERLVRPYYKQLSLAFFAGSGSDLEDEEVDDQVFSEYDEEKGVTFYPPMYAQRYAAVSDCLLDDRWCGNIEKIVDFGHHDMSFIKYLKEVPGISCILGVDIETIPLRCSSDLLGGDEYSPKRESPLKVTLFQGNAADPDYRLIGCDAVIAIEMIEHMLPHDLERFVHTVFGFIKPRIVIFTTPNADFNVLFKALEKNGLRRLDHLFEWTREQFHDWCSNIVVRYPNYMVLCKGIGPGPPGTLHHGCCSQLSLFISKEYNKQADLNINALASQLVGNDQNRNNFSEIFAGCWESSASPSPQPPENDSMTEILYPEQQSHMTLVFSSTLCNSAPLTDKTFNLETFSYRDQTLQCNLDVEIGKSFMMFDSQDYFNVMVPRRRICHKVYEIEDVCSRLNCTTLQVKKFSKTTQNLMAKNRIDSIVHTREVVNEIRHLTKVLNFNNFSQAENGGHVWCNINWGDNAPYWNQYYKIVREYAYPFETKSEEARILDLVSEEINRRLDIEYDEDFSVDVNRLEIPLSHLMTVVQHITTDVERVRDLLEWNGYEIVDDVVIHSRLVVDTTSVATHDDAWQDNDFSDWGTDLRSTSVPSVSDGSTNVPDLPGRCLRRALDQKLRNLRTMLLVDEDISTELDKVVCRLMKLALHSSMGRQTPPPARWMQCKLLDLLTLTEKAISRRKKCFIESFPLIVDKHQDVVLKQDTRVKELVNKYRHLIQPLEKTTNTGDNNDLVTDVDIEDEFLSSTSNGFSKENEFVLGMSPSLVIPQPVFSTESFCTEAFNTPEPTPNTNPLERTKAWLAEDVEVEPYPEHEMNYEDISSGDTDHSGSKVRHKHKKSIKKHKTSNKSIRESVAAPKTSLSKTSCKFKIKHEFRKNSSRTLIKNVARKKSNCTNIVEYSPAVYDNCMLGLERKDTRSPTINVAGSKPIPGSLIALCQPVLKAEKGTESPEVTDNAGKTNAISIPSCISATEESFHIDIITQEYVETIALRRTIGTDAKVAPEMKRKLIDDNLTNDFDKKLCTKHEVSTENVQSQTIFLNDINEPSTSKGIRHFISTDVQCGSDSLATYPLLSPSTSVVKMPQVYSTAIKINNVGAESKVKGADFGTSTQETNNLKTITPRLRLNGIKIKDSDVNLCCQTECYTMTIPEPVPKSSQTLATDGSLPVHSAVSFNGTKLIKPISSTLKIEDSGSEFCVPSIASTTKTCTDCMAESKTTNNVLIETFENKVVPRMDSPTKMTKLSCGAVHVHSYKDNKVSEDVVYQGAWQCYKPKANTRKKTLHFSSLRRSNEVVSRKSKEQLKEKKVNSKEKVYRKRQEKKQMEAKPMKPTQIRNDKLRKVSQEEKRAEVSKPRVSKSAAKISNKSRGIPRPIKTTKVASKHSISTNTSKIAKSTFTIRRSGMLANVTANKKEIDKPQKPTKSYIPLYLKRTLPKNVLNKSLDSASDTVRDSIDTLVDKITPLVRSNTEEIRSDLLKFNDDLRVNITYVVCRNDIEDKITSPDEQTSETSKDYNKSTPRQLDILKRSHSPSHSINSSTCSSRNSVATVKAASTRTKVTTKRHSAPSYKVNVTNSESDNTLPSKTKKVVKRYKAGKKTENKDINKENSNKENIPESTKNFDNIDKEKNVKSPFPGRPKSMCISQVETECSSPILGRQKAQISNKSNVKIPSRKDSDEKRRAISPSVSKKRSLKSDTSIYDDFIPSESESFKTDSTNMVLVLEPQHNYEDLSRTRNISRKSSAEFAIKSNHNLMDQLVHESSLHSDASRRHILDSMKQILEETLDRIIISHGNVRHFSSQHTIILSNDDIQKPNFDRVTLPGIKINVGLVESSKDDIKNSLHRTFDSVLGDESMLNLNDTRLSVTDLDLLSFKSITSESKYSEYYLADNELNTSQELDEVQTQNMTSVQDIFERKEPHLTQTTPGTLAGQAFSGFSLDAAPVAGDQPDSIAIIDSETGSMAVEINRQATSEELFISGRSSNSFESCVLNEDVVVPNWLFQLISQQQSVEEDQEEPVFLGPVDAPLDEPIYDANGNIVEPPLLGVAAGAGDGRGMHSDHSQDSSGRGTSVSSSDTSSGLQSEVSTVLIDPSTQFELLRDPMTSSAVVPIDHHSSIDRTYGIEDNTGTPTSSRDDHTRTINEASDVDADISSIDTDAPDLSDN